MYAGLYALDLYGYYPFRDLVIGRALAAGGTGLLLSTALRWGLRWLQAHARRLRLFFGSLWLAVFAGAVWYASATYLGYVIDPFRGLFERNVPPISMLASYILTMVLWAFMYLGVTTWRTNQAQQQRMLKLEAQAHEARLQMLRYQLNPHFLFNALNSISALADEDPPRIKAMVNELSGFLRYSLLDPEAALVPLRDELRAIERYLAVEQIRFEEDLVTEVAATPAAAAVRIPAFLLLPLVENAIKYGQQTSPTPLRIRVSGAVEGARLVVTVANTGRWVAPGTAGLPTASTGTGLRNVQQRLEAAYPGTHTLKHAAVEGWVLLIFAIPLSEDA